MDKRLQDSIDTLADVLDCGHLLSSTGGADFLDAATIRIKELTAEVERLRVRVKELYDEIYIRVQGKTK